MTNKSTISNNANPGDFVKIKTKKRTEEGILMPSSDEKIVLIKLNNGYNLGLYKKEILEIQVIKSNSDSKLNPKNKLSPASSKTQKNSKLKTVSILHCGGTIASKVDYSTGAVTAKFTPEEILEMSPQLAEIVNLKSRLISNMMSENMRFAHYNQIAKEIEKEIKSGAEGIIITHGTDTLHYTAAALSFILENLSIPVLLVGAQRSSDRGSSDAFMNLKCAVQFIAKTDYVGVATCLHHSAEDLFCAVIPGVRSRKMHSSRRDAFKAINSTPDALVDSEGNIDWLNKNYSTNISSTDNSISFKSISPEKLTLKLFNEKLKIGLIKAHPQMFVEELKIYSKFDGLVLEGTGLGHFPTEKYDAQTAEHELILNQIAKLAKKKPVVMTTQTIFGGVNMDVYSPGRKLIAANVLGNGLDLTTETAFLKLAWLLSNYPQHVKEMFSQNLRGEINSQRIYETDFLK